MDSDTGNKNNITYPPETGACYSHGWRILWTYFLDLLLILVVSILISIPSGGLGSGDEMNNIFAFYIFMVSLVYTVLVQWPVEMGIAYTFLKAVRNEKPQVTDIISVFKNYLNAVLAGVLVSFIIVVGLFLLIVPGIIFACKLAFVPYLIVEEKLDAVAAIQKSWNMTTGHAFTIFLIGVLAIFIALAGLIALIVGIFIAIIWIRLAMAALYHSVSQLESTPVQPV
jgi:uncharacterized membrane protein